MQIFFICAIFANLKKKAYTVCGSADLPIITGYTDIPCFQILVDLMLHTSPSSAWNCIFSIHMSKLPSASATTLSLLPRKCVILKYGAILSGWQGRILIMAGRRKFCEERGGGGGLPQLWPRRSSNTILPGELSQFKAIYYANVGKWKTRLETFMQDKNHPSQICSHGFHHYSKHSIVFFHFGRRILILCQRHSILIKSLS